jgi:hypothetical protein
MEVSDMSRKPIPFVAPDYDDDGNPQTVRGHVRDAVFLTLRAFGFVGLLALIYAFIVLLFCI